MVTYAQPPLVNSGADLHQARDRRNSIAHEVVVGQSVTWADLDKVVNDVQDALKQLGLVGDRTVFEPFGERIPQIDPRPGIVIEFDFRYGLKEADKIAAEIAWTESLAPVAAQPAPPASESPEPLG